MKNEFFKDVPGFEGKYQVSNLGNVRSLDREVYRSFSDGREAHIAKLRGKMMKKSTDALGYQHVRLFVQGGKAELWKVHQLVALTFLGHDRKVGGREVIVHHKNGIKNDNRLENLEVVERASHILIHKLSYAAIKEIKPRKYTKRQGA